nr:1,4-dihydroxy 2-naphthoate octaprenyltransferase [Cyanidioschyzonaceae sp. 1]
MNKVTALFLASRPKTLLVSICCWLSVSSFAYSKNSFSISVSIWALLLSLCLQIWANWVNDYLDFLNGIDHALRKGPVRLTKILTPEVMKISLIIWLAMIIGLTFYLKNFGIVCGLIGIAWFYSASFGLAGEWVTFFACGPLATYMLCGIYHMHYWHSDLLLTSVINGCWSAALLVANNIRDRISDTQSPKRSSCVWFGSNWAIMEYQIFICMCVCCLFIKTTNFWWLASALLLAPYGFNLCVLSMRAQTDLLLPTLIFVLRYCTLFSLCALIG